MNSANNLLSVGSNRKFLVEELVYCAECGTNHAEDATVCVQCGARLFMSQKVKVMLGMRGTRANMLSAFSVFHSIR